ncbi:MAG TPA: hypothetical protein VFZ89_14070, partial [Solirubrobacteraceae bacterium]
MRAARLSSAALLLAALLAAGCGAAAKDSTDDFRGEARQVAVAIEDYQDAARKGDEEEICNDLLDGELVRAIEAQAKGAKGSCPDRLKDSLRDADSFEIDVEKVDVNGTRATATIKSEGRDEDRTDTMT